MTKRKLFGTALLVLTAFIWGLGFPMQSMALAHVGAATLTCVRNVIAGFFLLLLIPIFDKINKEGGRRLFLRTEKGFRLGFTKRELTGGVLCGLLLGTATTLQQLGLATDETDSGKAAFITALYMVIVPLLGMLRKHFPTRRVFVGVALAVMGSYFLTANVVFTGNGIGGVFSSLFHSGFTFAYGDLMVLLCAFVFALHVFVIDLFSENTDGVRMSCIQFFVASLITLPFMLIVEDVTLFALLDAALPILYLGIFSSGVAYTGQIIGQKYVEVTVATLILSLESVFGALGGAVLLNETKTPLQLFGCAVVFGAVVLVQLPTKSKK
ncbi:MAG: DMT family transporter [Clostridia bacterium]|nr:DMT family transporter [Clostridia bacterium]